MKYILPICILVSQSAIAQVGSWSEYPSNCDTTEYNLEYITEAGHYVGMINATREFIYSIDNGQTWVDFCPEDDHRAAVQTEIPNNQEYFFTGRRFINRYNVTTQSCEQLFKHNNFFGLSYAVLLESGEVVAYNNMDGLIFFNRDGAIANEINLGPNVSYEQIHFEPGQKSYVTYNKSNTMETCLREIDLEGQSVGPERVMSQFFDSRLNYSSGSFYSLLSYSNDQGETWINYGDIDPTEEILAFVVENNSVFLFGNTRSYYSSDNGQSFTSNIHNITFRFNPNLRASIINNTITIYDRNRSNSFVATTLNFGATWNIGKTFLNEPSNWNIVAARNEKLITSSDCGKLGYDPASRNWQDFNASVFQDIKALPNDNLIFVDFDGLNLSSDNGTSWASTPIQLAEGVNVTCKEDITYITGFGETLFSTNNGVSFTSWSPSVDLIDNDQFDLFSNRKAISYNRWNDEDHFILHDFTTEETTTLSKSYNNGLHVDVATVWEGTTVYILEYADDSLSEMVLFTSQDEGRNFESNTLPFSIVEEGSQSVIEFNGNVGIGSSGQGVEMTTDQNGNIIIHNNKKIFITQNQGSTWLDITPTRNDITITGLTVSFDDYLYISTYGTGILKYNCKLNMDFTTCNFLVDNDGDGFLSDVDCNDNDSLINPGATETCNNTDDNCNGQVDEGFSVVRYYEDKDGDGYGDATNSLLGCIQPNGYAAQLGDCDDSNASINPDQTEIPYNGIDEDCNSATLDDDLDQDGFLSVDDCNDMNNNINPNQVETPYNGIDDDCNPATLDDDLDQDGYNLVNDCDDNMSSINPGAVEILDNGIDEDCDGMDATAIVDNDGDGYFSDVDCNDDDSLINPGATETCNNTDDNCNGQVDEGFSVVRYYEDKDGDGYGDATNSLLGCIQPNGYAAQLGDCDDSNASINPDQTEIPYNGIDEDCNSATLDDDLDQDGFLSVDDCNDMNNNINPNQVETPYNGIDDDCNPATLDDDLDQDGYNLVNDCDDNMSSINPGAVEILDNGIDEDCDGMDATAIVDNDGDGFFSDVDCNDDDSLINPGAAETCNNTDDNCNGQVDEGLTVQRYYEDKDGDGYGVSAISLLDCKPPTGYVAMQGDCDDTNASIFPGQTEAPYNGVDDDCNPATRDDDVDGDGYLIADDCDDNNPNINPDQTEEPYNGIDDDCNTATLDDDLDQDGFIMTDDCDDNNANVNPDQTEEPYNGIDDDCQSTTLDDDLDQDGFNLADDCDDNNANINPDATEIPNNDIDEDCDGMDMTSATHEIANTIINIYPNPAVEFIYLDVEGKLKYRVTLYDIEGKSIHTGLNIVQIQITSIPTGTYLLEIQDLESNQKIVERVVVGR